MTNEQAIQRVAEKLLTVRVNKDGSLNGNALHGLYRGLKNTFNANGMDHNAACSRAGEVMRYLKKRTTIVEAA